MPQIPLSVLPVYNMDLPPFRPIKLTIYFVLIFKKYYFIISLSFLYPPLSRPNSLPKPFPAIHLQKKKTPDVFDDTSVGTSVGISVGIFVGTSVGTSIGTSVGTSVGIFVGIFVGISTGISIDICVGIFVIISVGTSVSIFVGILSVF